MPKRIRGKRVRRKYEDIKAELAKRQARFRECANSAPQSVQLIKELHIPELTDDESWTIIGVFLFSSLAPYILRPKGRKPTAYWLDIVIATLRAIALHHHISPSLSFTDAAQTKIDTPFARLLTTVWTQLPPQARSKTPEAFIDRARKLRSRWRMRSHDESMNSTNGLIEDFLNNHITRPGFLTLDGLESNFGTFPPRTGARSKHV